MATAATEAAPASHTRLGRAAAQREQTRARYPDSSGYTERDGVRLYYEVYGSGEPTVFLLADVVDHPFTALEDADPLPGPALPRAHVRRAR